MKKIIISTLIMITVLCSVGCNRKINIEDTDIVTKSNIALSQLTDKYYNKFTNQTFTSLSKKEIKNDLYVMVAEDLPSAFNVSFGNVDYDEKEKVKFNIGNNSYIYAEAFYLKKKALYVFLPLLMLEGATTNSLLFCVDGIYFSAKIFEGESKKLDIENVFSLKTIDGTTNNIETEKNSAGRHVVKHTSEHYENTIGINLKINNESLKIGDIIFLRKSYQKYSEPTEYLVEIVENDNYDLEIVDNEKKGKITKEETIYTDLQVSFVGGGTIGFDLLNINKKA